MHPNAKRKVMVYANPTSRRQSIKSRLRTRGIVASVRSTSDGGEVYAIRGNGVCRNNMSAYDVLMFIEEWDQEH